MVHIPDTADKQLKMRQAKKKKNNNFKTDYINNLLLLIICYDR